MEGGLAAAQARGTIVRDFMESATPRYWVRGGGGGEGQEARAAPFMFEEETRGEGAGEDVDSGGS